MLEILVKSMSPSSTILSSRIFYCKYQRNSSRSATSLTDVTVEQERLCLRGLFHSAAEAALTQKWSREGEAQNAPWESTWRTQRQEGPTKTTSGFSPYHELLQGLVGFPSELAVVLPLLALRAALRGVHMQAARVEPGALGLDAQRALLSAQAGAGRRARRKLLSDGIDEAALVHAAFPAVVRVDVLLWRLGSGARNSFWESWIFSHLRFLESGVSLLLHLDAPGFTTRPLTAPSLLLLSPRLLVWVVPVSFALPVPAALLPSTPADFIHFPRACLAIPCRCVISLFLARLYLLFVLSLGQFLYGYGGATEGNHEAAGYKKRARESSNCHCSRAGHHLLHPTGDTAFTSEGSASQIHSP